MSVACVISHVFTASRTGANVRCCVPTLAYCIAHPLSGCWGNCSSVQPSYRSLHTRHVQRSTKKQHPAWQSACSDANSSSETHQHVQQEVCTNVYTSSSKAVCVCQQLRVVRQLTEAAYTDTQKPANTQAVHTLQSHSRTQAATNSKQRCQCC